MPMGDPAVSADAVDARDGGERRPRVLIIGNDMSVAAMRLALGGVGFEVLLAANSDEGLHAAKEDRADVILLDVAPRGDRPLALCRRIKADPELNRIPVILIAGRQPTAGSGADGLEAGADAYITRPIDPRELVAWVRAMLRNKQTEGALRDSEQHFRSLIEKALDLVAIVDSEGTYRYVSPSHQSASGFAPEELIGKNAFDFVHPDDLPTLRSAFTAGIGHGGIIASAEYRFRHKNGSWRYVEGVARNLLDDPIVKGVLINARDISERKQAEDEVRRLNAELDQRVRARTRQLEATNQELEAFAYSVSHDLRAPLRAIDGFSKALLEDYGNALDAQAHHFLSRVRAGTVHMAQLIDDLLSLSRVTRSEMRWQSVDLSGLAQTVASELRKAQPQRTVEFVIAPGLIAQGDAHLLRLVLENLLGNAWKYTSQHTHARIEFGTLSAANGDDPGAHGAPDEGHDRQATLVYFVRDDGAGFDMRHVDRLFRAFQRLHSTTEFEGTGIGLATVQRIIHRHGGRIWAEGAVDRGATFYFSLAAMP
jgi:PAS domain S-box-containing protein